MIQKVNHFAISVKDLNQVVAFFRDVFGLTKIELREASGPVIDPIVGLSRVKIRQAKIEIGGVILEFV